MSSLIGKSLQRGKYKLEAVLGRGGFGLTFRAHQNYLDKVVVIKTLNESFWSATNLSDLQRQFQDEARRLALCSHPNVVRVSDFFVEDRLPYMVMDYIPGRSLYDMVIPEVGPAKPLSEAEAVGYIQQIGKALQAVHSKGLLHRDVKPQNIMIHQLTGEAVLIDFGIARELTQNPTKTHTSIVSEGYAPIEQYLPKAQRSAATDIYGLAATLYTLLTGEVPVAAVLRDRTPLPPVRARRPDVSEAVARAIAYGLNVELKDRPQSVGRWLSMLTATPGTVNPTGDGKIVGKLPTPSEIPTRVVAPGYQSGPLQSPRPEQNRNRDGLTGGRTVAVPLPGEYAEGAAIAPTRGVADSPALQKPRGRARGCGCVSTLAMVTLAIAGIAVGSGYWLYNRFTDLPEISLPTVEQPETENTTPEETPEELPEAETEDTEQGEDPDAASDEAPEETVPDVAEPDDTQVSGSEEQTGGSVGTQPPLLLGSRGNPENAQPGNTGGMVAIPGFGPGESEDKIRGQLGAPTQEAATGNFYTAVYDVVPNRVSLAYVYDRDSVEVRQSEATFSPATDRLVMRTALLGMLDGRSTRSIEAGLEAVRTGERDRFDFESKGFAGSIERNDYGHIHIYVRE
ncbi:MAG: serine/threonine-protein kinase [Cyanobacteria bacterium J06623_4]